MLPRAAVPHPNSPQAAPDPREPKNTVRLQRLLAMAGVDSRRNCDEYIKNGRVTVDGDTVLDPAAPVDPMKQKVALDGERLRIENRVYYLLNKPSGVLCTNRDPQGRTRVIDLFPKSDRRLFTVGRLDENSRGLLLVTNDGDLAERLAHPRYRIPKIYRVNVQGVPSRELLDRLKRGLHFAEGRFRADDVRFVKRRSGGAILDITLSEGQNREVRRMLARIGHKVLRLERVALGPLILGDIPPGAYRPLSQRELMALLAAVSQAERETKSRPSKSKSSKRRGSSRGKDARSPNSAARQSGRKPSPSEGREKPDPQSRPDRGSRTGKPSGRPASNRPASQRKPGPIVEVEIDEGAVRDESQPVHPRFRRGGGRRPPRNGSSEVFDE